MATPSFPSALPMVRRYDGQPLDQVLTESEEGRQDARRRSFFLSHNVQVEWLFVRDQLKVFQTFRKVDLLNGHKKFYILLPTQDGITFVVARFAQKPKISVIGHRAWTVTADLEVEPKTLQTSIFTSWPYAVFFDESFNVGHVIPMAGQLWQGPLEEFDIFHVLPQSGYLNTTLVPYDQPAEEFDVFLVLPQSGTLDLVLVTHSQPAEEFDVHHAIPQSGSLDLVLVPYTMPFEEFEVYHVVPIDGYLT